MVNPFSGYKPPSPVEKVGYAVSQGGNGRLSVINTATGQVHWTGTDPSAARQIAASLNAGGLRPR